MRRYRACMVVTLSGDIDVTRAGELRRLAKCLLEPDSVIFDVSKVAFVDSTFIRFLLDLKRHVNKTQRSSIKIVGITPRVRRIFEVTGLTKIFELEKVPQHV